MVLLGCDPADPTLLRYRLGRGRVGAGESPDAAAARLAVPDRRDVTLAVLHSTSWRYDAGVVVLTYAALPDGAWDVTDDWVPLRDPAVLASGDPRSPSPRGMHAHHVVAHAVRHLAYLAEQDPGVRTAAASSRAQHLWSAVRAAAATMPTGTHTQAHRAAAHAGDHSVDLTRASG